MLTIKQQSGGQGMSFTLAVAEEIFTPIQARYIALGATGEL